jgi:pyruvate,orthophosphate dikinase
MPTTSPAKPIASAKRVYLFGASRTDGTADMKNVLGGKGANLAEMANLGLPVPPGFTITTDVCNAYTANGGALPDGLKEEALAALAEIGSAVGAKFGDVASPLLVSVRSGARASMPGMMDTILNLGLNDETVTGLVAKSQVRQCALCLRQLSPLHPDVFRCRARRGSWRVRGPARQPQEPQRPFARH